ncbi:MAG: YibE/F family protein [Actinomycetaceae bacterium]|nr:YibE/F family protein [Actinomycetaceae bacterium]
MLGSKREEAAPAHSHSHGGPVDLAPEDRRRVVYVLAGIVIPLAAVTLIALVMLWPRGQTPVGTLPLNAAGTDRVTGPITSIGSVDDTGQTPVTMEVDGVEVPVHVPPEIVANGLDVGDEIQALFNPRSLDSGVAYVFVDFVRTGPMVMLLVVYVLAVALVARFKGIMALVGLGVSLGVVGAFMIPALTVSGRPVFVILVASAAMMFASIYLAHGISIRTTTAVLGTFSGLVITTLLAWWAVGAANLTGALSDESRLLAGNLPSVNLQALLLGGMILAGLGALNDVTITQVSTVWELHAANPKLPRRRLFVQGMTVGRDHIASTVYTLAFAYVGTAIALLMGASLYQRSAVSLLQLGDIAEEIIRTLVASIGLVLAIPLTTAIAAALAPVAPGAVVGAAATRPAAASSRAADTTADDASGERLSAGEAGAGPAPVSRRRRHLSGRDESRHARPREGEPREVWPDDPR